MNSSIAGCVLVPIGVLAGAFLGYVAVGVLGYLTGALRICATAPEWLSAVFGGGVAAGSVAGALWFPVYLLRWQARLEQPK